MLKKSWFFFIFDYNSSVDEMMLYFIKYDIYIMHSIKTKENDVWIMHIIDSDWFTLYDIYTNPWNYRGWKIYFADKIARIISWECLLIQEIDWVDKEEMLNSGSGEIIIKSWVPHIFKFENKCRMIEIFPSDTKSEEYERYRLMKNK